MKIRSIRPEFFSDPKMVELSPLARILYMGLWCYVDDEGRGEYLPKRIEGEVFPLESVPFDELWAELEELARVVRYDQDGHSYFHIPTFSNHQKPNRKYDSKLPPPSPDTVDAARTQRVDTDPAPPVEGEGEGVGEGAAATRDARSFDVFHRDRAAAEVQRRQREGLPVKNPGGLQRTIASDPEFVAESQRLWAHRDCSNCHGKGETEVWAPGGTGRIPCEEPV